METSELRKLNAEELCFLEFCRVMEEEVIPEIARILTRRAIAAMEFRGFLNASPPAIR